VHPGLEHEIQVKAIDGPAPVEDHCRDSSGQRFFMYRYASEELGVLRQSIDRFARLDGAGAGLTRGN